METVAHPSTESNGDLKQRNIISNGNGTTHKPANGHVTPKVRINFISNFCLLCAFRFGGGERPLPLNLIRWIPFFSISFLRLSSLNFIIYSFINTNSRLCVCLFLFRLFSIFRPRGRGKIWIGEMFGFLHIYTPVRCIRCTSFLPAKQNCWLCYSVSEKDICIHFILRKRECSVRKGVKEKRECARVCVPIRIHVTMCGCVTEFSVNKRDERYVSRSTAWSYPSENRDRAMPFTYKSYESNHSIIISPFMCIGGSWSCINLARMSKPQKIHSEKY